MGFSFKECLKNALIQAIGKKADYEIILSAADWIEKGVLTESDIAEIQTAIDAQYAVEDITQPPEIM